MRSKMWFRILLKAAALIAMISLLSQFLYTKKSLIEDAVSQKERALTEYLMNLDTYINNPSKYKYSVEISKSCQQIPDLQVIAVVHSAINNFQKRHIIRKSWGSHLVAKKFKMIVKFFLGKSSSESANRKVIEESQRYGDIVVQDFTDSYKNLTLKSMSWMQWIVRNCPQPKYVLKLDDDMMINVFRLDRFLKDLNKENVNSTRENLFCRLRKNEPVLRHKNKWYVSKTEFFNKTYPDYCPGIAVLFDRPVVDKLNAGSRYVPFFWIDDVYFTGLVREFVGAKIVNIGTKIGNLNWENKLFELVQNDHMRLERWKEVLQRENSSWPREF